MYTCRLQTTIVCMSCILLGMFVSQKLVTCGIASRNNTCLTKALPHLQALPSECLPKDIMEPGKLDEFFDKMDANNDGQLSY